MLKFQTEITDICSCLEEITEVPQGAAGRALISD